MEKPQMPYSTEEMYTLSAAHMPVQDSPSECPLYDSEAAFAFFEAPEINGNEALEGSQENIASSSEEMDTTLAAHVPDQDTLEELFYEYNSVPSWINDRYEAVEDEINEELDFDNYERYEEPHEDMGPYYSEETYTFLAEYMPVQDHSKSKEDAIASLKATLKEFAEKSEKSHERGTEVENKVRFSSTTDDAGYLKPYVIQLERLRHLLNRFKMIDSAKMTSDQSKQAKDSSGSTRQMMSALEEQFCPIDFRDRVELQPKETLKNKHYQIIAVEEILVLAEQNGWGIGHHNDFPYIYNGSYWQLISAGELREFLSKVAQRLGINKFDAKHHLFIDHLYKQFMEMSRIPARENESDAVLINLANGTFEFSPQGQQLRPADKDDFLTYQLPFTYDPDAVCPLFDDYLCTVLPDEECRKLLAEFIGFLFVNSDYLKLEKALILHGSGANGKSVFFEIISALLGPQNVSSYSLASLTDEKGYHRAKLQNVLVNYASEITEKLDANMFKQLASGEPIEARLPYGQPFILTNYAKLIFNCNELPKGAEQTPAFFRRFAIVPFDVTIPESKQDRQLASKIIQSELSGVFNWVIGGLKRLLEQRKLTDPPAVREQLKAYQLESDSVKLFLDEFGYIKSSSKHYQAKELYNQYKFFCTEDGHRPVSKSTFMKRLRHDGFITERKNIGWMIFLESEK
ncbi:hypothetical protein GCM10027592_63460 [Spirosoma flavus]